jgi:hypothetical protein
MSFAEIKEGFTTLTVEERLQLAALIAHLNRAQDNSWQEELDRRPDAMTAGKKHSQAELEEGHNDLLKRPGSAKRDSGVLGF